MTAQPIPNLQFDYDAAPAVPQIVINNTPDPLTVDASVAGDIFAIRDAAGADVIRVANDRVNFGTAGNRDFEFNHEPTGTGSIRYLPDGRTKTTIPVGSPYALAWDSAVTTNIAGGAPFGNDTAPAMVGATGTCTFADAGGVFSSSLLFNQGTQIVCQANVGPVYTMVNQPKIFADGGSFTCSQHNALRIQPRWGTNINGGSITQTTAQLILFIATVDAAVGSANVGIMDNIVMATPNLTNGGTITTWTGINIANITGPTTITGISSAMSNGTFINHTGTAPVILGGPLQLGTTWAMSLLASNIATLADGDSLRVSTGVLFFGSGGTVNLGSSVANRLDLATGDTFRIINGALEHLAGTVGLFGATPVGQSAAYTRNATVVEDRTLLASASATTLNNNNVIAALIADLQAIGILG